MAYARYTEFYNFSMVRGCSWKAFYLEYRMFDYARGRDESGLRNKESGTGAMTNDANTVLDAIAVERNLRHNVVIQNTIHSFGTRRVRARKIQNQQVSNTLSVYLTWTEPSTCHS